MQLSFIMNEDRKKRGLASSKFLTAVAISALFLGSSPVQAAKTAVTATPGVTEQMQTMKVTVTVVDALGPVAGANVIEKGTTNGAMTGIDGKVTLEVKKGATLQVSFVGYETQEIKATGSNLQVTLKEDSEVLSEVVVVGFGTQKKENLTGAVASVDVNKTLQGRPIADVGRGLQGTTPGLSIVVSNSDVGSDPTIKVRGQIASYQGSSSPLILLDNVEIPSIQMINPDDIESISVLKDAAASSIYGAKAAFGVVLITSKKGAKTESVNVSYQGSFSWQNASKEIEMGTLDAMRYSLDAAHRVGADEAGAFFKVSELAYERAKEWQKLYGGKIGKDDPVVYGRDWYYADGKKYSIRPYNAQEYMIEEWAPSTSHNISVSGKSGSTAYNIGLAYLDQNGLMAPAKEDDFRRWNGSVRLSTDINKYITARVGAIYSKRSKRYAYTSGGSNDPFLYLYRWSQYYPAGQDEWGQEICSPYNEIKNSNVANKEDNYLNFNVGATINITKDWKFDVDYTYAREDQTLKRPGTKYTGWDTWYSAPELKLDENGNSKTVTYFGETMPQYWVPATQYIPDGDDPDHIYRRSYNAMRHTLNITTNYNWQINDDHNLKFLFGMNRTEWEQEDHYVKIPNLTDINNPSYDKTNPTMGISGSGNLYWDGQIGFFGRVNYNWLEKYLVEANLRYDATSKFPSNLRWRWYPSFSAGWRVSEEVFMNWAKPALSSLKFRASWGMIGDQSVAANLYVPTMTQSQISWIGTGGTKVVGVGSPAAVRSDIGWQDIKTLDVGFDARFFNGELGLTFDWYQRDTENMIVPGGGVTATFGTTAPKGNFGSLRTRGWEVAVDYNHQFKNGLNINAMFTIADAKTEITAFGTTQSIDSWYVGKTYGEIWGYRVDRLYQKSDFVYDADGNIVTTWALNGKEVPEGTKNAIKVNKLADPNAVYQEKLQGGNFYFGPGDVKYKDLNGDGMIDTGSRLMQNAKGEPDYGDLDVIGNTTPRYEWGFRLGASWKGVDASVFLQGVGSRQMWGTGALVQPGYNSSDGAIPQAIAGNYWTEENPNAFYPAAYNHGATGTDNSYNYCVNDRYLLDMTYWRIKNITVGYTLPAKWTKKAWINKARAYVTLENFFTFDNLGDLFIDPEVSGSGSSLYSNNGRTGVGTPTMKTVSVGVQLNF